MTPPPEGASRSTATATVTLDNEPDQATTSHAWSPSCSDATRLGARSRQPRPRSRSAKDDLRERHVRNAGAAADRDAPLLCIQEEGIRFARGLLVALPFALTVWALLALVIGWAMAG
jgi:hypothetical protein